MENKRIIVWIVDDDKLSRQHHLLSFSENRPDICVKSFERLSDVSKCNSQVDYIFVDISTIDKGTISHFDDHSYIDNFQSFIENSGFSFIILMSAMGYHAICDLEDIKEVCPDRLLFALDSGGRKNTDSLVEFVNKYSPLEEK